MNLASRELILASNEHPTTQDLSVATIEVIVHYKGTEVTTVSTPRFFTDGRTVVAEKPAEPIEEIPRKTAWEFLLDDSD